ncbi:hypothetical protein ABEV54_15375 [Peribacillus psychrosaccharolyticus]|uniref:hypothetical protein n=1 Tax=Peribacillus psychrosaccharolyticus TaxID=1407 RepID=UPI003D28906B
MLDINMKVNPSFFDDECAIVFSFSFVRESKKIGEAIIYTCEESGEEEIYAIHDEQKEKIAYLREFSIMEEYHESSMKKIQHFLKIIGIKKCINQYNLVY